MGKLGRLKDFWNGVKYSMFPVATISDALGVRLAVSSRMESAISGWMASFHARDGLGLPAAISAELARLTTLECEIELSGSARASYLTEQLRPVLQLLRAQVEFGAAGGGLVFKPYPDGNAIAVSYVKPGAFYPTSFDSRGKMTGAVFLETLVRDDVTYKRLEYHHMEADGCVIENHAYKASSVLNGSVLGEPVPLTAVEEWASLEPRVRITNVDRLLLGYFKMPLANTIDAASPLGVSAFSRAALLIEQANEQWKRILWEYEGTELAIHADATLFRRDDDGALILPKGKERYYRIVHGDLDAKEKLATYSPDIRDTPLFNGLNNMLKRIEYTCGLAYGTLSDPQNVDKTAEEIKASKQRSYSLVRDMQKSLESALGDLLYAMDVWAGLNGAPVGAYKVAYNWDDSIVSDPCERKQMFWGYVTAGKFPMWRYLMEFEGYTEADARAIAAETSADVGDPYVDG